MCGFVCNKVYGMIVKKTCNDVTTQFKHSHMRNGTVETRLTMRV